MKPEAQRIAVAEVCGWHFDKVDSDWYHPEKGEQVSEFYLPDYLNDLNAMHEAEKTLTNQQRRQYTQFLVQVHPLHYDPFDGFEADPEVNDGYMKIYMLASMTAAQRAEAFLRTIGKWTE